jgi:hypothetical protein
MNVGDIFRHIYLPLLTQETAVMISTLTYGLRAGVNAWLLVLVNTLAVSTDLCLFFVPVHFLSRRLHDALVSRFQERYDTGVRAVERFGPFRTATALGFVMPSVAAMIVVGLLRLSFWRALAGLFVGSAVYIAIPLLIALPLSSAIPSFILPVLQWVPLSLVVVIVLIAVARSRIRRYRAGSTIVPPPVDSEL